MPRRCRNIEAGFVYHVLNRAAGRAVIFQKPEDYRAFLQVLKLAQAKVPMNILAYCLMPTHFHLMLKPNSGPDMSQFMHYLSMTHASRWHTHYHTTGTGPLYQGRFKSFPIQEDDHLLTVMRYIERNPLRAGLVDQAEQWRWSSLRERVTGNLQFIVESPTPLPKNWLCWVNDPQTLAEEEAIRTAILRGTPYGNPTWSKETASQLGLQTTQRPRGRPRKTD